MAKNTLPQSSQEDTRQRMICAALQLFKQIGYANATTRAIADAAGVNEVTLFRHFGSKKNLLMASVEAFNAAGFSATFESQLTGEYTEDIRRMAHLQIQNTLEGLDMLRLMVCDSRHVPELREAMQHGAQSNMALLSGYFQRQIDGGVLRADFDANTLADAFNALFSSAFIIDTLLQDAPGVNPPSSGAIQGLVDLFVRGTSAASPQ